jgi:hypothetical protein
MAALALSAPTAHACGGFFCNVAQPVDQSAEEIVFRHDPDAGTVTMHVRISYEGPSDGFAWVVPVPEEPTLEIGTNALFPVLSRLRAQWQLNRDFDACDVMFASAADTTSSGGGFGVDVLSEGIVGPYETAVLDATDASGLVGWLHANAYDVPDNVDEVLAPYIADGMYFVALKLAKDRDTGDLQPLAMTWHGKSLSIPIQLTSIAATEDMGLRVYVLGEHRAVPQSYFHLVLNHLAVDWWTGGGNIEDVVTRAANEAGGHGFFTDYAGSTELVRNQLYFQGWDQLPALIAGDSDPLSVVQALVDQGVPLDDDTLGVLADAFGLSEVSGSGFDLVDLVNCVQPSFSGYYYYPTAECSDADLEAITFDPVALAADLEARVLEPRKRTDAMIAASPMITRLTSSVSPVEMTVDPTFVLNPSMADVPLVRAANEQYWCGGIGENRDLFDASRTLTLQDGRSVDLPSLNDLAEQNLTSIQWLEQQGLTEPANARIEQAGPVGPPEVVVDNTELLFDQVADLVGGQCGCQAPLTGGTGLAGLGLGLVAALRRRRVSAR